MTRQCQRCRQPMTEQCRKCGATDPQGVELRILVGAIAPIMDQLKKTLPPGETLETGEDEHKEQFLVLRVWQCHQCLIAWIHGCDGKNPLSLCEHCKDALTAAAKN